MSRKRQRPHQQQPQQQTAFLVSPSAPPLYPPPPPYSPSAQLTPTVHSKLPPLGARTGPLREQQPLTVSGLDTTARRLADPPARFELKTPPPGRVYRHGKINPAMNARRGCTDVICCFLFAVFIAGWAVVAAIAFMWGNPERLIHPTDSLGRTCGVDRPGAYNLSSRPYLLFFDMTKCVAFSTVFTGCQTPQVCVSSCPSTYFSYLQMQVPGNNFSQMVQENVICIESVNKASITSFAQVKSLVDSASCTAYTVASAPVLGRCIPGVMIGAVEGAGNLTSQSLDKISESVGKDHNVPTDSSLGNSTHVVGSLVTSKSTLMKIAADVSVTWWQMLTLILASAAAAFLWTIIMRLFGGFMIYTSILLIVALLGGGTGFAWYKWRKLETSGAINDFSFQPIFSLYFEMPTTWLVIAIAISVLAIIVLLILFCVRSRLRVAVAMIEESSKAIAGMMSTLIFPILPFVLHVLAIAIWATITIWLASSGQENCRNLATVTPQNPYGISCDCRTLGVDSSCSYVNMTRESDKIFWLQMYNLFGFFWLSCFVTSLGQITLAGAFASYYWAANKKNDVPAFPVIRSLKLALRYNMGSLAFGSLIIAIVKLIRVILDYLDKKLSTTQNKILHYIFLGLKCFFWCMEVFLKFLSKNAFIMMSIYGHNFFSSAKDSFLLLARNAVRVVVINQVTTFLLLIGRLVITAGAGAVAYFYFSGVWVIDGLPQINLYYYFVPIIIVVIGSFFIADVFFEVYEMAVDTTFICFLEDSEQNDGSPQKPYFMSNGLLKILGKQNQSPSA